MPSAVFDLDGTLAETAPDLIGALNDLLIQEGLEPVEVPATRLIAGRGGRALIAHGWARSGRPLSQSQVDVYFPEYLRLYAARIDRATKLYPGVEATLPRLAEAGWALSVCTNKPEGLALDLLERLGILNAFGAVVGADTLPVRKPSPEPVRLAVERAGGGMAAAVLVGDTQTDRDAAKNAGVASILVTYGYALAPVETLDPEAIIERFDALPQALQALTSPT